MVTMGWNAERYQGRNLDFVMSARSTLRRLTSKPVAGFQIRGTAGFAGRPGTNSQA